MTALGENLAELFSDAGSIPAISTIDNSREYRQGTPCYYHLTDQWTMAGIEGDRAEVRALRRTEGKNDTVYHF